jgi:hypothetical protein
LDTLKLYTSITLCQRELSHNCKLVVTINVFFITPIVVSELHGNQENSSLMDGWKTMSTWCYNHSCKLVALELHNHCSYTITTELHELHTYMVPHMVNWISWNSCNSSNNTHSIEICWFVMKLQVVIATQKHNCKVSCKSPYFSLWDHTHYNKSPTYIHTHVKIHI